MLYHKLHWGHSAGGAEFLLRGSDLLPVAVPLNRPCHEIPVISTELSFVSHQQERRIYKTLGHILYTALVSPFRSEATDRVYKKTRKVVLRYWAY